MQEAWVQSLGLEDPLEKGMATHSGILAWEIPGKSNSPWDCKESDMTEWESTYTYIKKYDDQEKSSRTDQTYHVAVLAMVYEKFRL